MNVKIYTFKNGLETISDVIAIRIKSSDYNLLILKDYISILGEIKGEIEFETAEEKRKLENIKAYYINSNNNFELLLEGE